MRAGTKFTSGDAPSVRLRKREAIEKDAPMAADDDGRDYSYNLRGGRSIKDIPMEEIDGLIVESIEDAIFLRLAWLKLQGVAKSLTDADPVTLALRKAAQLADDERQALRSIRGEKHGQDESASPGQD